MLAHILANLLKYFLIAALTFSGIIVVIRRIAWRTKGRIIFWGNIGLLCLIIFISIFTLPPSAPLQIEWALYAMHEEPDSTYSLWPLLGDEDQTLLGILDSLGQVRGIAEVQSGDHAQMRIKLNRKGNVYIFHFDSSFNDVRQLFPAEDLDDTNPIPSDFWLEIPHGSETFVFDQQPGLEMMVVYINVGTAVRIGDIIREGIDDAKNLGSSVIDKFQTIQERLRSIAPSGSLTTSEYFHNLSGVKPSSVRTYIYKAKNGESAFLFRVIRHLP